MRSTGWWITINVMSGQRPLGPIGILLAALRENPLAVIFWVLLIGSICLLTFFDVLFQRI